MEAEVHHFYTDPTFWVALAFLVFVGVVLWVKVPRAIANGLDKRAEKIKTQIEEARELKEEAQSLLARFQRKHRDATKTAEGMIQQAKEEAEVFSGEARKNLKATFERQTKAAEEKIAQAEVNAVKEVRATASEIAIRAAEALLRDGMGDAARAKLTKEAISDLPSKLG